MKILLLILKKSVSSKIIISGEVVTDTCCHSLLQLFCFFSICLKYIVQDIQQSHGIGVYVYTQNGFQITQ